MIYTVAIIESELKIIDKDISDFVNFIVKEKFNSELSIINSNVVFTYFSIFNTKYTNTCKSTIRLISENKLVIESNNYLFSQYLSNYIINYFYNFFTEKIKISKKRSICN